MLIKKKKKMEDYGMVSAKSPSSNAQLSVSTPSAMPSLSAKTGSAQAIATIRSAKKGVSAAQAITPMAKEPKGKVTDEPGFAQQDADGEWRMKYLDKMKKRK